MILLTEDKFTDESQIIKLYKENKWSSAEKPKELIAALKNSHSLIMAWDKDKLVGLGNAISDGHLVVYYPHLIVSPQYQGKGIGKMIMEKFQERYATFHQQILVADGEAIDFYKKCGFSQAGNCQPLWVYQGHDHD